MTELVDNYTVDLVLCIDATGSMVPLIRSVKKMALKLHEDIVEKCEDMEKHVEELRVKVISFRDYYIDEFPMTETEFFQLPEQNANYENAVNQIRADAGGDEPESSLEALYFAMTSEWQHQAPKRRQVIVMFTDASAHPLEKNPKPPKYPKDMPTSFAELYNYWDEIMHPTFKRLVIFAPDVSPWDLINQDWEYVIHHTAKAGEGLQEHEYNTIVEIIAQSF